MPVVTDITEQKRRPNRRNIYLDGAFAFGCNVNVVAKHRLATGLRLSDAEVSAIRDGEVRQACFDHAVRHLERRLHSRAELRRKLTREAYGDGVIDGVLDDLQRLGYVDDAKFAAAKAGDLATYRRHGPRRATLELRRAGVADAIIRPAVEATYDGTQGGLATARELIAKKLPSVRRLDPLAARRRLAGMLLRRGFEYETIKPLLDEALDGTIADGDLPQ